MFLESNAINVLTLDCSLQRSSVHGIFQATLLEWVAIPSPGDLPDPKIKPTPLMSLELASRSFQNWCITKFCVSKRTPLRDPLCLLSWKIKEHILEEIPPIGLKKKKKATRKCSICSSRGKHSETLCFCSRCCDPLNRGTRLTACHALMKY